MSAPATCSRDYLGSLLRGAIAGLLGTLAMDLVWYVRYRREDGEQRFLDWEFSTSTDSYKKAGAPAQVGRQVFQRVVGHEPPPQSAGAMNDAVHLLTGAGWGIAHGALAATTRELPPASWLATGAVAWGASYATLAPAGIYKPIWEYAPSVLWQDLSAHLVFGLTTGAAFEALTRV